MKIASVHQVERPRGMSAVIGLTFINGVVRDNDVIRVEGTGENMLARDLGAGRMVFVRGFGSVGASPVVAGDEVIVVGNCPPIFPDAPVPPENEHSSVPGRMSFTVLERKT